MSESGTGNRQHNLYSEASSLFGAALTRLAVGYEIDPERRRDLLQEIHLALWKSLETFDGRCSLRTWVYRVGHNVATNHVIKEQRMQTHMQLGLEEMDSAAQEWQGEKAIDYEKALHQLTRLIHQLKMPDRQVMLLYLDDVEARTIAEITGISAGNVATKIHRIKNLLAHRFHSGVTSHA